MKIKKTFTAQISIPLGYRSSAHAVEIAQAVCVKYCNKNGTSVTIVPSYNIAPLSDIESSCFIVLYARPKVADSKYDITGRAIDLAKKLMYELEQNEALVITTEQTFLIEQKDLEDS